MARKTTMYRVTEEGRDKGKTFLITEESADLGEKWAAKAILGLMASGTQLPDNYRELGMAGLAEIGFKALAGMRWELLEPLLDTMFGDIQFVGDPQKAYATTRPLILDDIEEISTRLKLRYEWWKLHMGFFQAVVPSLIDQAKAPVGKHSGTRASAR